MRNRNMPAKPIFSDAGNTTHKSNIDANEFCTGLTKLEYAAIKILASLLSDDGFIPDEDGVKWAIKYADRLFDELEKQ